MHRLLVFDLANLGWIEFLGHPSIGRRPSASQMALVTVGFKTFHPLTADPVYVICIAMRVLRLGSIRAHRFDERDP